MRSGDLRFMAPIACLAMAAVAHAQVGAGDEIDTVPNEVGTLAKTEGEVYVEGQNGRVRVRESDQVKLYEGDRVITSGQDAYGLVQLSPLHEVYVGPDSTSSFRIEDSRFVASVIAGGIDYMVCDELLVETPIREFEVDPRREIEDERGEGDSEPAQGEDPDDEEKAYDLDGGAGTVSLETGQRIVAYNHSGFKEHQVRAVRNEVPVKNILAFDRSATRGQPIEREQVEPITDTLIEEVEDRDTSGICAPCFLWFSREQLLCPAVAGAAAGGGGGAATTAAVIGVPAVVGGAIALDDDDGDDSPSN